MIKLRHICINGPRRCDRFLSGSTLNQGKQDGSLGNINENDFPNFSRNSVLTPAAVPSSPSLFISLLPSFSHAVRRFSFCTKLSSYFVVLDLSLLLSMAVQLLYLQCDPPISPVYFFVIFILSFSFFFTVLNSIYLFIVKFVAEFHMEKSH